MQIDTYYKWHIDYSWDCACGKHNEEPEERFLLKQDMESIFCSSCNKEYILDKSNLKLTEKGGTNGKATKYY